MYPFLKSNKMNELYPWPNTMSPSQQYEQKTSLTVTDQLSMSVMF